MSGDFAAVDAYIASLEDRSGIVEAIIDYVFTDAACPDCDGSGYATRRDGTSLGICPTCAGAGGEEKP